MTRSGQAGARALKMVSTTVIGMVIHQRSAAGFVALTTRPGGSTMVSGRKAPSLMGRTRGVVRHLKATSQAERPAVGPELKYTATWLPIPLRSQVIASPGTSTRARRG